MEQQKEGCTFNFKDNWHEIIKFLDISDLFNLELVNRELRDKVNNAYSKRNQDNKIIIEEKFKKNKRVNKKRFFEYHMNAFINFGTADIEFNNEAGKCREDDEDKEKERERQREREGEKEKDKDKDKDKKRKKSDAEKSQQQTNIPNKIAPKLIEDRYTAKESLNRLFSK